MQKEPTALHSIVLTGSSLVFGIHMCLAFSPTRPGSTALSVYAQIAYPQQAFLPCSIHKNKHKPCSQMICFNARPVPPSQKEKIQQILKLII